MDDCRIKLIDGGILDVTGGRKGAVLTNPVNSTTRNSHKVQQIHQHSMHSVFPDVLLYGILESNR